MSILVSQSTYMNSLLHSRTWQYAGQASDAGRDELLADSDFLRVRGRREERAVEPVDLRARRPRRPAIRRASANCLARSITKG
jgi:hypothetical protein